MVLSYIGNFGSKEDYFFVIVSMILVMKILIMKTMM